MVVLTLVVLGAVVAVLTAGVTTRGGATHMDRPTMEWAVAHRTDGLTPVVRIVTDLGGTVAMTAVAVAACAWFAWRRRRYPMLVTAAVSVGALVTVTVMKALVGRRRPPVEHLVTVESHSFPSGHTLGSTAVVGTVAALLALSLRRRAARIAVGAAAVLFTLAIGLSRIYLGVHWPTDVLAGWALGALWIIAGVTAVRRRRAAERPSAPVESDVRPTARR
ncbi:undecaprenyl-diphosphatase [Nocardia transvalensis]|uniref:Undecaprenyl-diphosphatase n=1 Tax=Nocardia transvalensis TaxID=37333 RepID=A0A7W9UGR4_9NOCA|nr:phosphatase PAP2 family protein [Nocardia transvalensis]MBB5912376.1 undecaprenyl-diphosphatase [Nocardia transvalensis]